MVQPWLERIAESTSLRGQRPTRDDVTRAYMDLIRNVGGETSVIIPHSKRQAIGVRIARMVKYDGFPIGTRYTRHKDNPNIGTLRMYRVVPTIPAEEKLNSDAMTVRAKLRKGDRWGFSVLKPAFHFHDHHGMPFTEYDMPSGWGDVTVPTFHVGDLARMGPFPVAKYGSAPLDHFLDAKRMWLLNHDTSASGRIRASEILHVSSLDVDGKLMPLDRVDQEIDHMVNSAALLFPGTPEDMIEAKRNQLRMSLDTLHPSNHENPEDTGVYYITYLKLRDDWHDPETGERYSAEDREWNRTVRRAL